MSESKMYTIESINREPEGDDVAPFTEAYNAAMGAQSELEKAKKRIEELQGECELERLSKQHFMNALAAAEQSERAATARIAELESLLGGARHAQKENFDRAELAESHLEARERLLGELEWGQREERLRAALKLYASKSLWVQYERDGEATASLFIANGHGVEDGTLYDGWLIADAALDDAKHPGFIADGEARGEERLRKVLKKAEWIGQIERHYEWGQCPWCRAFENHGHNSDCELQAALAPEAKEAPTQ